MPRRSLTYFFLIFVTSFSCVYAQTESDTKQPAETKKTEPAKAPAVEEIVPVKIVLVAGAPMLVDEVSESADGYWYKRGNMSTFIDREKVVRIEHPRPAGEAEETEVAGTPRKWSLAEANKVKEFFLTRFNRPLPLSAFGQSDLHTRWGLDHRNGMDVNLHPDSVEGRALVAFLRAESIPFLVFRGPIPGVATGPHIHVGNRSSRSYGR
ncbi:MAG TPA: hypothetical protein VFR12_11345 [Pyrinomonadaceae bacterium]|nr:hypothetical protein [Pyrinomonadaceae bacterium]